MSVNTRIGQRLWSTRLVLRIPYLWLATFFLAAFFFAFFGAAFLAAFFLAGAFLAICFLLLVREWQQGDHPHLTSTRCCEA